MSFLSNNECCGDDVQERDGLSNELVDLLGGQDILIIGPPLNNVAEDIFLIRGTLQTLRHP